MPGGVGGGSRKASPYPDRSRRRQEDAVGTSYARVATKILHSVTCPRTPNAIPAGGATG